MLIDQSAGSLSNGGFDQNVKMATNKQYQYMVPSSWTGRAAVVVRSGSTAWGGLHAAAGSSYFLSLQGLGSFVQQHLSGLVAGHTYVVRFSLADRPGYGEDESLHVKIDDVVIWESTHPENGFSQYSAIFTAKHSHSVLKFENDSPEGDRSMFVDSVSYVPALHPPSQEWIHPTLTLRILYAGSGRHAMPSLW